MSVREQVFNFLEPEQSRKILNSITEESFPWYICKDGVSGKGDNYPYSFYFFHVLYRDYTIKSPYSDLVFPILNILKPKALVNIKINLYPHTHQIIKHGYHNDQNFDVKSFLYFVNDNNGVTTFKDTEKEYESVANSGIFFNSNDPHCSSTCSDAKFRITINFNYF